MAIDASADHEITFPLGPANKGHMKGDDYLNHFVLPNFYFHITAAYAILRNCGVDIGKRDFLGCDSSEDDVRQGRARTVLPADAARQSRQRYMSTPRNPASLGGR